MDVIEQFLDQFFSGHALGQVPRRQSHRVQRGDDLRAKLSAKPCLDASLGFLDQERKLSALWIGKPHDAQPPGCAAQVF